MFERLEIPCRWLAVDVHHLVSEPQQWDFAPLQQRDVAPLRRPVVCTLPDAHPIREGWRSVRPESRYP